MITRGNQIQQWLMISGGSGDAGFLNEGCCRNTGRGMGDYFVVNNESCLFEYCCRCRNFVDAAFP